MEFDELLDARHSIRAYRRSEISEVQKKAILEAISKAPSAGNLQSFRVYLISGEDKLKDLADAANGQDFISRASICLVFCADPERSASEYGKRGIELYSIQDATIAATFAVLKTVDLGLSCVWVGAFNEENVRNMIGAYGLKPVAIIPIGEAAEKPQPRQRRKLSSIVQEV